MTSHKVPGTRRPDGKLPGRTVLGEPLSPLRSCCPLQVLPLFEQYTVSISKTLAAKSVWTYRNKTATILQNFSFKAFQGVSPTSQVSCYPNYSPGSDESWRAWKRSCASLGSFTRLCKTAFGQALPARWLLDRNKGTHRLRLKRARVALPAQWNDTPGVSVFQLLQLLQVVS